MTITYAVGLRGHISLNPIELKGVHGTRAVSVPERLLSAAELEARVCTSDECAAEAR
jgi:hypothetical protein